MAAMAWCLLLMDTPVDCAFDFWIRNWISTQASGHHVIKYPQGIDTPSTKHKNWNLDEIYSTLISPFVNWWFFGPSGEPKVQCPKSSTAFWARAPVHLAAHIVPTHSEPQACCSFPKKRRNKQWSIFRKQLYIPIWRLLYTKLHFVNWSNIYIYRYLLMNWQTNHQRAGKMLPLVSWESMPAKTYGPTGPPKTLVPQNKAGYFLEGSRD